MIYSYIRFRYLSPWHVHRTAVDSLGVGGEAWNIVDMSLGGVAIGVWAGANWLMHMTEDYVP